VAYPTWPRRLVAGTPRAARKSCWRLLFDNQGACNSAARKLRAVVEQDEAQRRPAAVCGRKAGLRWLLGPLATACATAAADAGYRDEPLHTDDLKALLDLCVGIVFPRFKLGGRNAVQRLQPPARPGLSSRKRQGILRVAIRIPCLPFT